MDDKKLLYALQQGSKAALEMVMERYNGYVYHIILNRGRGMLSPEDGEELTADVFVKLWQKSGSIKGESLRSWLGTVARNAAVDHMRKKDSTVPLEEACFSVPDDLWKNLQAEERTALVRNAMNDLPPMDREIFYRYYNLCQSMKDIAEALNMGLPAVKMRLHRGRKQLKNYFQERGMRYEDCV